MLEKENNIPEKDSNMYEKKSNICMIMPEKKASEWETDRGI